MRHTAFLVAAITLLAACGTEPTLTRGATPAPTAAAATKGLGADVEQGIATLRAATARFHRYEVAKDAQYTFLFMNSCMVDDSPQKLGAMGYHYVNTQLLDGHVDLETPEALLYEPGPDGQLNLVAVEYVIPKDAWHESYPPQLLGQELKLNQFDLYALHVWTYKNNPSGIFASWNPTVSCANATIGTTMSHP
jgi:hypothetical protein